PRRTDENARGNHILTRVVPISLMRRTDLAWLLPRDRITALDGARSDARGAYDALSSHGALFFDELLAATGLLPAQLEDALSQLAALGLVTADGFGAVRSLTSRSRLSAHRFPARAAARNRGRVRAQAGRWSRLPPPLSKGGVGG